MKFERTDEYEAKLFGQALFDDKNVIKDAEVVMVIQDRAGKLKAYCTNTDTFLQFPRALRTNPLRRFTADVVEVIRTDGVTKYYRAMKGSIRNQGNDEVVG